MKKTNWLPAAILAVTVAALDASLIVGWYSANEEANEAPMALGAPISARISATPIPGGSAAGWRMLGPGNIGGRIRAVAIDPASPDTLFVGSVSGGIWKSTNGGESWAAVDDFLPSLAISSIVFDPAHPGTMYAGTGEGFGVGTAGAGVLKSSDGGSTWTQLSATAASVDFAIVNRLAISPNGAILLAATTTAIFRSLDGGASFSKTSGSLGTNGDDPAIWSATQVVFHPTNPLYALATGYGPGILYSRDGGATWIEAAGLDAVAGSQRIEVAYSRSAPDTIYAVATTLIDALIYKSSDGGATFAVVNSGGNNDWIGVQAKINLALWVNPSDSRHLVAGALVLSQSRDGGVTWTSLNAWSPNLHADQHVVVEDPRFDDVNTRIVYVANDGGIYKGDIRVIGTDPQVWFQPLNNALGISQFYAAGSNRATEVIVGGTQDNGTLRYSPSTGTNWKNVYGGDTGYVAADQTDPNYFYQATSHLQVQRSTNGGLDWVGIRSPGPDTQSSLYIAPLVMDPANPRRLLIGGYDLWRTDNARDPSPSWSSIKPPVPPYNAFISAIAVSPINSDDVWIGYLDGEVFQTSNATTTTPSWRKVYQAATPITSITISAVNPAEVYVARDGFEAGSIARTTDRGSTWVSATGTGSGALPRLPVFDVAIDPARPQTIYAGTESGVFRSDDAGVTWDVNGHGPANVRVTQLSWIGSTLIAATYGRGVFALDTDGASGAPAVSLNPSSLTFASQTTGITSAPQSVTITNSGTAPLTVQGVTLAGTHPGDFIMTSNGCTGTTVAAGGNCALMVAFRPVAAGARSAVLAITDNGGGSPHTVPVTGTGVDPAPLPSPWRFQDIGAVGTTGRSTYSNGTFSVSGAGADVWGSADAFQFAYQPLTGDGTITARVATVQPVAAWTKAGVMIREALTPGAAHAFMIVSAGKGVAFQRRTASGALTTSTSGISGAAPRWVRLARAGTTLTASYSSDGVSWITVGRDTIQLGNSAYVGLAVSSHDPSQLANATFDQVSVAPASPPPPPPPTLPPGWATSDVGAQGAAGSASATNGTYTVAGAGADVWGTADAFRYAYYTLPGDGAIVARVASIENVAAWTKAGVMLRQTLAPDSPHAFMLVSVSKGLAFQRRTAQAGLSTSTSGDAGTAPRWVKLVRTGQSVAAYVGPDGVSWTLVGQDTIALSGAVWAGLAVSSHDASRTATAVFDNVAVSQAPSLPPGWQDADIDGVGVAGTAAGANGSFTVKGAGADVWGSADAFHYAYTTLPGDGELIARVTSVEYVAAWTKAGVMIRASLSPSSPQAFMVVSAGKGLAFQRRVTDGGLSTSTSGGAGTAPTWVRLVRSGSAIAAYTSADGSSWALVAQDTFGMGGAVYVGLAVSSHDTTRAASVGFDSVSIR